MMNTRQKISFIFSPGVSLGEISNLVSDLEKLNSFSKTTAGADEGQRTARTLAAPAGELRSAKRAPYLINRTK